MVVTASLVMTGVGAAASAQPGESEGTGWNVNSIRMIRMFAIVRIFGRMKKLNQIVVAITSTLLPVRASGRARMLLRGGRAYSEAGPHTLRQVAHSFILVGIASSIYAVLATNLYQEYAPEHFGSWSISSITLLQLATFDSWHLVCSDGPPQSEAALVLRSSTR